jgi:RNA polymerase sigma factor (TIGR02999 family)
LEGLKGGCVYHGKVPDVTDLLDRWRMGDRNAFEEMVPLVYGELKQVARRALRKEHNALTLDCTDLVHETYLRLVDQTRIQWNGRAHFFGAAAQVMRRILVEHARNRLAKKRGAGAVEQLLDKHVAVALEPDLV